MYEMSIVSKRLKKLASTRNHNEYIKFKSFDYIRMHTHSCKTHLQIHHYTFRLNSLETFWISSVYIFVPLALNSKMFPYTYYLYYIPYVYISISI